MPIVNDVPDSDMPQLYQAADRASLEGQNAYVNGTRWRLLLLAGTAILGIVSWRVGPGKVNIIALAGVTFFVLALLIEGTLWRNRPDYRWYDGRAVAESIKSIAWKFSVCGLPFPCSLDQSGSIDAFLNRMDEIRRQFSGLELAPLNADAISEWMVKQRESPLDERRESYLNARIKNQLDWYAKKAEHNRQRSKQWRFVLVAMEFLGVTASIAAVFFKDFDPAPAAIAAIIAAVIAWLETKQHDSNSRAYAAAVVDLSYAKVKLRHTTTEAEWAKEVDDAEEAISREHVVWLATRSRL